MKNVLKYWRNDYKWNKHQKKLNSLPQFVTNIDGIDLHFLHVKADKKASQKGSIYILTRSHVNFRNAISQLLWISTVLIHTDCI